STTIKRVEPNSQAAKAGLTPGMTITDIEVTNLRDDIKTKRAFDQKYGWPYQFAAFQLFEEPEKNWEFNFIVKDAAGQMRSVKLPLETDPTWFFADRGFSTMTGMRTRYADGAWDAVRLGARETKRFLVRIYMTLYGFLSGNISGKNFSGPI